ncbi:biotin--[acetyl-CoA-carboxylase] ligase [Serpentinicella alkaliphila]|uniref:Bifunctional ligase/repressor BirA n=1 Tax=Serpentinicella alkaliphila TaxID=1734049 RepID=A0A4V2T3K2_9FIRM|nr:biotin--[acetyl-CoA-carboxylase] ligase [Serpentinicella alkaliphila]TCQ01544.1 BirA family biotin operon repressor/biotin-[acetyl-CoA-carboxylase] ligase [Serpentinicella alkaliphila]
MMVIILRNDIIEILNNRKGEFISGEELSYLLKVSRTAIWKHINILRKEGYEIESVHKKGYRIVENYNSLLPGELIGRLQTQTIGRNIIYFESIDSTNDYCKQKGNDLSHGTVVISEEQLLGRGRLGRAWASPKGEGIWMSIFLKPHIPPLEGTKLTQIAAAAVCSTIRNVVGIDTLIKWPNDIVFNGKKLCGILTEMSAELNEIHYLIVGVGINVNTLYFSEEISDVATSIAVEIGKTVDRKTLVTNILKVFEELYEDFIIKGSIKKTIAICKEFSAILNKKVNIIRGNSIKEGLVIDITEEGNLLMLMENGEKEVIQSGEVSVRGLNGYV